MRLVIVSLLFLSACSVNKGISARDRIEQYCKKCGGLKHSALNENSAVIECKDGSKLIVEHSTELILGECK